MRRRLVPTCLLPAKNFPLNAILVADGVGAGLSGVAEWSASMTKSWPTSRWTWRTWTFRSGCEDSDDDVDAAIRKDRGRRDGGGEERPPDGDARQGVAPYCCWLGVAGAGTVTMQRSGYWAVSRPDTA